MTEDAPDVVYLDVTCGEPRPAWCDQCLTSVAITFDLFVTDGSGFQPIGEGGGCPDCGTGDFGDNAQEGAAHD